MKVLVSTLPFGEQSRTPLDMLENADIDYTVNPLGRKFTEKDIGDMVSDFDAIIAGTEPITEYVMHRGGNLKLISRVGIGLDSVDLNSAERRGISVSYTPDAPSAAVSELTIGLMLSTVRLVHVSNLDMHNGEWHRYCGRRLPECTIGIIGAGRIGGRVIKLVTGVGCRSVLVNDIDSSKKLDANEFVRFCSKKEIYREADIISVHVPLTMQTRGMIGREELQLMKEDAIIVNTSRGGIINEDELYDVLIEGHLGGVALDVFQSEPYVGRLSEVSRCLLTSHMGSMSVDCRKRMEIEATAEVVRFKRGEALESAVPKEEYELQRQISVGI